MKINIDFIYPIGSIYISTESINPSVLFGGKWEQTCKSRCLMGAGSNIANTDNSWGSYTASSYNCVAGSRFGEPSHLLTQAEMPSHSHSSVYRHIGTDDSNFSGHIENSVEANDTGTDKRKDQLTTGSTGGGTAHNNMPPVEVYYIWKRVS